MATKLNVPVFDEDVDISQPSGAAMKFVGMAGGAALALAAVAGGQFVFNTTSEAVRGEDESEGVDFV